MKKLLLGTVLAVTAGGFSACKEDQIEEEFGVFELEFDHKVGDSNLSLAAWDDTNYPYTNAAGQTYNVTNFGYYITGIKLTGPDGAYFEDHVHSSADPNEVHGYYHILESEPASKKIMLSEVPAGKYNQITFTLGIPESGVQEGATGGVLDPAQGAWFWNWDAGYIGVAVEGQSPSSPEVAGAFNPDNFVALHIGGWKEVPSNPNMVNNTKVITLNFSDVNVGEGLEPSAHLYADVAKILDGPSANIDFSVNYSVHSPIKGQPFAGNLLEMFSVDHVHQ